MRRNRFICLGIESSCDETAAAVVADGWQVLSNVVVSQENLHKVYGGVVPEIACRAHLETIVPIIDRALKQANIKLPELSAIAVTHTPGLVGALLVGLSAAKVLSLVLAKPLIGINHLEAHLYTAYLQEPEFNVQYPMIGLVVSGGHTSLFLMRNQKQYRKIAGTIDDAAGEAFDKVAAILGLPYPGGPSIEQAARRGNLQAIKFPRGWADNKSLDFSFSGLKTAVLYYAKGQNARKDSPLKPGIKIADVAAGFQSAVAETIVTRLSQAVRKYHARTVIVGGGVSANKHLRERISAYAAANKVRVIIPPIRFCTDNAAMVAGLAYRKWRTHKVDKLTLDAIPT